MLGGGLIDVHAHVLPGVDDGARSMEEARKMLWIAAAQGVRGVIATPHETRGRGQELAALANDLEKKLQETYPDFRIYLGQENYYHEELTAKLKEHEALTMAGSRYVLTEFAPGVSYRELYRGCSRLFQAGYTPILAHMERYACLREEKNLLDLTKSGCLLQMNYSGLSGKWYLAETRWRRRQVLLGRIDFLGSDMHRMDFRPPKITAAEKWLKSHVNQELLEHITRDNALHIINREWINRGN
ncbi:MAG: protein tyrosine phosphatase [Hungatella sp.]|nr:protein tyrosine phosphatase [Hungatella sp.]